MKKKVKKRKRAAKTHLQVGPKEVACRVGGLIDVGRGWTSSPDVADVTCQGCRSSPRFRFALAQPVEHLKLAGVRRSRPASLVTTKGRDTLGRFIRMPPSLWALICTRARLEGVAPSQLILRACRRLLATPPPEAAQEPAP